MRRGAWSAWVALAALLLVPSAGADPHVRPGFDYGPGPSPGHVHEVLTDLVQWQRSPFAQGDEARDYLLARYEAMGLPAEVQEGRTVRGPTLNGPASGVSFPPGVAVQAPQERTCENVVATVPGRDPDRWVVIGGHYDAVFFTSVPYSVTAQGAFDNGVGTSVVFELARLFHQYHTGTLDATLVFVHFDCEELGEHGAYGFVEQVPAGVEVAAAINLDMVGLNYPVVDVLPPSAQPYYNLYVYTSPVEDLAAYEGQENVSAAGARFAPLRDLTKRVAYQDLGLPPKYVWVLEDIEGNSDQRPFTEAGIPALWLRGMHHGLLFNRGSSSPEDVQKGLDEMNYKHLPVDTLPTLEAMAGGKGELLRGIRTPLDLAYGVALAAAGGTASQPLDAAGAPARGAPGLDMSFLLAGLALAALTLRRRG
jgi:hypothetical protein